MLLSLYVCVIAHVASKLSLSQTVNNAIITLRGVFLSVYDVQLCNPAANAFLFSTAYNRNAFLISCVSMYAEPSVVKNLLKCLLKQFDLKMYCKCRKVVRLFIFFRMSIESFQVSNFVQQVFRFCVSCPFQEVFWISQVFIALTWSRYWHHLTKHLHCFPVLILSICVSLILANRTFSRTIPYQHFVCICSFTSFL